MNDPALVQAVAACRADGVFMDALRGILARAELEITRPPKNQIPRHRDAERLRKTTDSSLSLCLSVSHPAHNQSPIPQVGPPCRACGECCDFERAGHRLYASTGELALLTAEAASLPPRRGRCPYQVGRLCTARERRPLGCRVYFCSADGAERRRASCEEHHAEIRRLHEARSLPYRYVEMTAALENILHPDESRRTMPLQGAAGPA